MEISEGGFSAMLTEELKVGEEVEVSFNLSGTGRVKADAIVKDKNLFRYGFEFVDLNEEVRSQVRETCASLLLYTGGCH